MKKEEKEKFERYVNNISDSDESAWVESLLAKGEKDLYLRQCLEEEWNRVLKTDSDPESDLNPVLDHIHHLIRKKDMEKNQRPVRKIAQFYMRAAAILFFPLLAAGILINYVKNNQKFSTYTQDVTSSIYAPYGSRVSFNLPDGTRGMLNSGSTLTYSLPFKNKRHIKLEGEGWFEVNHDEKHPFEISAGNSNVRVLGTCFNLNAYPDENYVEIVLQKGKVEFQNKNDKEKVVMAPSERLVFNNGKISKSVTDPEKYSAWTEGKLVFRGDPMAEVARRIERWYNVKVILADSELEKYSFRGTFEDNPLEQVMHLLSMTSPITYKIVPEKLAADGSCTKEEVTIYFKK